MGNLWFLSDFKERFVDNPRFLTYRHTRGMTLAEDFEALAAALEVAMMTSRHLVLPDTMNCRNCPAFGAYGMNEWPVDSKGRSLGCTFDYFSRAGAVTGEWTRFTVESGIRTVHDFQI